ncbi:nose resistant to fluoxetine protein 6-like [Polistes fuscatus]|uniref:nose resistant to fluoxetine protein 6-like n=1 Tax=Polistes fuscatus TaxID=30207 RepID=UPI001CA94106|nr:nose resistant to fluoxetine protein 6-like [Polistes fuscatus]
MERPIFKFLNYFAALIFYLNYCTADETKELKIRTLPVYAMLANAELLNSTQCRKELIEFREAIDQQLLWSLKVIDASSDLNNGFIYGNNYWLGSRSQCEYAKNGDHLILSEEILRNNSRFRHIEDEFPPFEVKFFAANFQHNSTLQYHIEIFKEDLIILGMCLPASCSKKQLFILLENVLRKRTFSKGELYLADFTLVEVRDLIDDHRWLLSGTFITMMVIVVLTFLLMIIGTTYDVLIYQERLKKDNNCLQDRKNVNSLSIEELQTLNDNKKDQLKKLKYHRFFCKIFLAFSAYSNTKIIFGMKSEDAGIPIIHGLRFFSMIWIISMHTGYFSINFFDNRFFLLKKLDDLFFYVIYSGTLAVDTFFCFGGFLVSYLYLKKVMGNDIRAPHNFLNVTKLYFLALLKRFIRLSPTFMILIGLEQINVTWYSKTSLFYITERSHENCQKYWWRNILYIHNLFSVQDMCMSWSWYLANDMQYFLTVNFLLFLSSMYFKVAASLMGLLFTSSIILSGYISYIYKYTNTLERQYNLGKELYYSPLVRIGPYLVGVITAYILLKLNNKLLWKKKTIILFWILGSLCNLSVLFGLYQNRLSVLAAAIYVALGRNVWAIGIAWILIACCTNNGGIVNRILSWKVWMPLSRLTYGAFLINPILITSMNLYSETSPHFDDLPYLILGVGFVVVSYICAYVVSLMFEMPYVSLMKEWMKYLNKKHAYF